MKLNQFLGHAFALPLLLISLPSIARKDYAITLKGDTLRGELKYIPYAQSDKELYSLLFDRLQIDSAGKKKKYNSIQIKSFLLEGITYETVKFENTYRFMRLVKPGYLGLYSFPLPSNPNSWDGLYLYKKHGEGIELPHLGFRKYMIKFLSDCPELKQQLENNELGRNDLDKIIDTYNSIRETKNKNNFSSAAKIKAIDTISEKLEQESFDTKDDLKELLADIKVKVKANRPVSSYMIDRLKSYITEVPSGLSRQIKSLDSLFQK